LILGVIIGTTLRISQKIIAAIMAFGSGVLICALTFGLMEEAFKHGGFDAIIIGFLLGGLVFISGDFLFLEKLDLNALGIIESFASGAILAMLADSMMPEAYEDGGFLIGFLTMLGFLTAFILSKI
jgi:zinc transporter ZupT